MLTGIVFIFISLIKYMEEHTRLLETLCRICGVKLKGKERKAEVLKCANEIREIWKVSLLVDSPNVHPKYTDLHEMQSEMQQQRLPCWKEQMRPPLCRYKIFFNFFLEFKKPSLALYVWAGRGVLWRFSVTTNCDWFIAI